MAFQSNNFVDVQNEFVSKENGNWVDAFICPIIFIFLKYRFNQVYRDYVL